MILFWRGREFRHRASWITSKSFGWMLYASSFKSCQPKLTPVSMLEIAWHLFDLIKVASSEQMFQLYRQQFLFVQVTLTDEAAEFLRWEMEKRDVSSIGDSQIESRKCSDNEILNHQIFFLLLVKALLICFSMFLWLSSVVCRWWKLVDAWWL